MDFMRDLVDTIGLQPEHFNYLIVLVIVGGGIWAVKRLYNDLTGAPIDYDNDPIEPIRISFRKKTDGQNQNPSGE